MAELDTDFSECTALVVDGNPTSRSILVSQLRDFGVATVAQAARPIDARKQLEYRGFDFVLCEQHFATDEMSGQDLLDDLRRNQLLPFSTIFIMITGEATYAKVAEAAESALDGYLLKPHKAIHLGERLAAARTRKVSLQGIFSAIEEERFEEAAAMCMDRFESRGQFWLYAARVGAELLLRLGRHGEAQVLYKAVIAAKTLPWARLGVARAQLEAGNINQATGTLENLINDDPSYADAYDVMARAYFELGRFDKALETYKMASTLTPASVSRVQNLAMMTYYSGNHEDAERLLDKTVRLGIESKMFDSQSLVLLAFTRLESNDRKGLQRCQDDFLRLIDKDPDNVRLLRLSAVVDVLSLIQQQQFGPSLNAVRDMARAVQTPQFDFESASNLVTLVSHLARKAIQLDEVASVVEALAKRFCSNRSITELLAASALAYPPYQAVIRTAQTQVLEYTEAAMTLSLAGDPTAAVKNLILHGKETMNARLAENAYQLLQKHSGKVKEEAHLQGLVNELRVLCGPVISRASLGEQRRQAGGLALRTGKRVPPEAPPPILT
ncbi:tetratricopeptide repeat protein [Rhodoferax saidenbachensis]|uniref:Tetratricopeptide (TPR) repeat protein n=1 Tax=Rhodoferax saidenbachensis TaxID=1484693 RepID=A0ABU1ZRX5_9BURK|nr:tetratricopeptide repeat protein [Rhodoferax saidenbachensis]MDR7308280.1 tetratricopeptide (TPR) repeat protein [Rhodoferax saidenbachensis]